MQGGAKAPFIRISHSSRIVGSNSYADGGLLYIKTATNESFTITHRLHALEARLDPRRFIRLSRGTLANVEMISQVSPMPGGTYVAMLSNGQELGVSRIRSRALRETLLKL